MTLMALSLQTDALSLRTGDLRVGFGFSAGENGIFFFLLQEEETSSGEDE